MKQRLGSLLLLLAVWQLPDVALSEDLIMTRSLLAFPEAMLALQESIVAHGYTVSRVQRIDVGLTGMGYETDKYRVVFAGKIEEIRQFTDKAPQLTPFLPPKIAIFAENEQTVLVTINPQQYGKIAGDAIDPAIFDRWENDLRSIFNDVNSAR